MMASETKVGFSSAGACCASGMSVTPMQLGRSFSYLVRVRVRVRVGVRVRG